MPQFDGSVIVDTKIDTAGIQRDTKKVEKAARKAGDEVEDIGDSFREAERDAGRAASGIEDDLDDLKDSIDGIGTAIKASFAADILMDVGSGVMDLLESTEELRGDLSKLDTNARNAGIGLGTARDAMKQLNTVTGETDSSIEAVSNLLAAGVPENKLQEAVEGLANAAITFPDTVKIESLADSLQETLATGQATGQFAEVLDRVGYGAENFSNALALCTTEAQAQELALNVLTQGPLKGVYDGWAKANPELVEGRDATLELQEATAELAESLAPALTYITKLATKAVDFAAGMDNLDDIFFMIAGGIAALGAMKAVETVKGLAISLKGLAASFATMDKALLLTKASAGLAFVAFGLLFGLLMKGASLWDSMGDAEKVIFILGALTAAAFTAALAVGAFQSALTMGIAVAAITAGIGAMIIAITSAEKKAKQMNSEISKSLDPGNFKMDVSAGQRIGVPALATGAVIPPNGEFLAILGDQKHGRNLEAPEGLMRQIVREESGKAINALHIYVHRGPGLVKNFKFELDKESAREGHKLTNK